MFMSSSSPSLSSDLSGLKDLVALLRDPSGTDKLISDLQSRVNSAKSAEDSASVRLTNAQAVSDFLDVRTADLDKREQTLSNSEATVVSKTQALQNYEQQINDAKSNLAQASKDLTEARVKFEQDQASSKADLIASATSLNTTLDQKIRDVKAREDAVALREQAIAIAQTDLDAWKDKVSAAAALVAAIGKS